MKSPYARSGQVRAHQASATGRAYKKIDEHYVCTWHDATSSRSGLLSGRSWELVGRLNGATVGCLIVDEDCGAYVELLLHLEHFDVEWNFLYSVICPFACDERFNDASQRVRTQHSMGNYHGCQAPRML